MTKLEVGLALDTAVCRALGITPVNPWTVNAGQESNEWRDDVYPPVSTDRTAMWLVWDALVALGCSVEVSHWPADKIDEETIGATVSGIPGAHWTTRRTNRGSTQPEALCRAALAALGAS
jgi:hypothetical protein